MPDRTEQRRKTVKALRVQWITTHATVEDVIGDAYDAALAAASAAEAERMRTYVTALRAGTGGQYDSGFRNAADYLEAQLSKIEREDKR